MEERKKYQFLQRALPYYHRCYVRLLFPWVDLNVSKHTRLKCLFTVIHEDRRASLQQMHYLGRALLCCEPLSRLYGYRPYFWVTLFGSVAAGQTLFDVGCFVSLVKKQ